MAYFYILEFGGQHTDLIGNRLEEIGFDVKYASSDKKVSEMQDAAGIILSGGPKSANDGFPYDEKLFDASIPVLGICYGMQLLGKNLGANIHRKTREYGETKISIINPDTLFDDLKKEEIVWMNHGDSITEKEDFEILAYTEKGVPAAIKSRQGPYYGVQFHPEVTHTEKGNIVLRNFAEKICRCAPIEKKEEFDADKFIEEALMRLRDEVGSRAALVYTSGGVDSTVAACLAKTAGLKIQPVYLEMGNGRKGEAQYVSSVIGKILNNDIYVHDASSRFIDELYGVHDPEQKRKIFSPLYARTRQEIENKFGLGDYVLIQGTIATDRRETGKEAGKYSSADKKTVATIKTHHNVGAEDLWKGRVYSPLSELTKDRVRAVARKLGIPREISERQPFPGPGLYVRFVTGYYPPEKSLIYNALDIAESYGMNCYVLPRKGVGLKGDERAFEHAVLLSGERDWKNIRKAAKNIIEDLDVSRVLYLPTEANISQEELNMRTYNEMTKTGLDRLREITFIVESAMKEYGIVSSQTPVITFSLYSDWMNVIRDVNSKDFRTLRPLKKPEEFPWECYDDIVKRLKEGKNFAAGITAFDVSDKPGGTTEWE